MSTTSSEFRLPSDELICYQDACGLGEVFSLRAPAHASCLCAVSN